MNLQPVNPPTLNGWPITLYCSRCAKPVKSTDASADLDDKPGTYYCQHCAVMVALLAKFGAQS